jgi:glycopeptide antibiotics resistance protein
VNRVATQLLLAYLAVLLALTFLPLDGLANGMPVELRLRAFATIKYAIRLGPDFRPFWVLIGNVLAFVPLGVLLPLASRRWSAPLVIAAGLALSVAIEVGQYAISASVGYAYRQADIDDVIANVLGVAIGYLIFAAVTLIKMRPSARRS